ncbi:MAG: hypothetical protein WBE86_10280 [Candidatus Acidiferrales bacterium]
MSDTIRSGAKMSEPIHTLKFPPWVRWASLIWIAVWFPAYWRAWSVQNFLHVCDIAVILTCAGLWWSNSLLLSSQAVSSIVADLLWDLDAGWRLLTGHNLTGGTGYMWDAHYPLWVRLLSLFHAVWPILLLWSLKRTGYDRRGWLLQSAIAAGAMIAARFANPAMNINYAFRDPIAHRAWGPAPVHVALIWIGLVILIYVPTHLVLAKLLPAPAAAKIQLRF